MDLIGLRRELPTISSGYADPNAGIAGKPLTVYLPVPVRLSGKS